MSVTTPKDIEVMKRLQDASKLSKTKTSEDISRIFFEYYNLDYKNINTLPHDLKVSLDTLQKQGYLKHNNNNLFIKTVNSSTPIDINNTKHIVTLTTEGERYITEKSLKFLNGVANLFINKLKI